MASGIGPVEVAGFPHILDLPYYFQLAISYIEFSFMKNSCSQLSFGVLNGWVDHS